MPPTATLCVQEGGHLRFKTADLGPVLQGLLSKLFGIFSLEDSSENEYVMKTIMRVISFVGPEVSISSAVLLSGPEARSRHEDSSTSELLFWLHACEMQGCPAPQTCLGVALSDREVLCGDMCPDSGWFTCEKLLMLRLPAAP